MTNFGRFFATISTPSKGYSQDYMAELINITQSAYARFERGTTKTDLKT
jgi:transcriptional regulator with XRE-family HTH domain